MELKNTEVVYSSDKCEIICGESTDGRRYIRKNKGLEEQTAELLMQVKSPYIARLVEYGENYTIYEYADGIPLNEAIITPDRISEIFIELCEGLSALHKSRIIHRDIKPSNIILCNDGHVKIIDFDAARILKPAADKDTVFIGTDGFAPPEQYGFTQTDQTSDIYSMGITMKVLLGEIFQHSRYRRIIGRCTRFSPEQRYKSADKVRRAVILRRYSGAVAGASSGVAAIACLAIILAVLPRESAPEITGGTSSQTEPAIIAELTTASTKAVTEPSTTARTTSSSKQTTASAEPEIPSSKPVEITEQEPASEPEVPVTSASTTSAAPVTTKSTKATTKATAKTTKSTTTSAEPQEQPVETVTEIKIPEESIRPYNWDTLYLPVGFPKLADNVSTFRIEKNWLEFSWDLSSEEEARAISEKVSQWANYECTEACYVDTSWTWHTETYDIFEIYYKYTEDRKNQLYLQIECNIPSYEPFQNRQMQVGEFSIPGNSERPVSWDSADVPDIFPKVTESATEIFVDTDDNEDYVSVMWDRMESDEIVAIIDILIKWYGDDDILLIYHDGIYQCQLDTFSTHKSSKYINFGETENLIYLTMKFSKN